MITYLVDFILTCSIFFTFFYYDFPFAAKISKFKDASNMNNIQSISIFQLFQHNLKAVFREGFYVLVRLKATEEAKNDVIYCRNKLFMSFSPFCRIVSKSATHTFYHNSYSFTDSHGRHFRCKNFKHSAPEQKSAKLPT